MKEKMAKLMKELNEKLEDRFLDMGHDEIEAYAEKLIQKSKILSIHNRGRLEGFIAFYDNDPKKQRAFLSMVAVDYDVLGQSYGKALMEGAIDVLRKQGFSYLDVEVDPEKEKSMRFISFYNFGIIQKGKMFTFRKQL